MVLQRTLARRCSLPWTSALERLCTASSIRYCPSSVVLAAMVALLHDSPRRSRSARRLEARASLAWKSTQRDCLAGGAGGAGGAEGSHCLGAFSGGGGQGGG